MHRRFANALVNNEFVLFYQPVLDLQTGEIVGCEALCRWPHSDNTFTSPEIFIPQAESSGFIVQLGEWVLRTATQQVRTWHERFDAPILLEVNLSARQFVHYNLMRSIETILEAVAYPPELLEFEITETVAMTNADDSIGIMRQLKNLGIALALDDFGTGYSSLSHLKRFPIDKLKIDKSFVRDIPSDGNDLAIVSAIIAMAHALSLKVQAEGVETEAQSEFLREIECELAQGFLFARPLPPDEFESLFERYRKGGLVFKN
ncbi:MAG: putative bifunctional diguanylate cyclase/phosphodiesterase [Candidatus Tyrphobacter sp.]